MAFQQYLLHKGMAAIAMQILILLDQLQLLQQGKASQPRYQFLNLR
ncbi:MAG: hypothetical protein KME06_18715 [Kastovskya adunca ATA6-11-RM4]|nr:hypothetical protein [Kastovskya adunca ATA6-11-RM4]